MFLETRIKRYVLLTSSGELQARVGRNIFFICTKNEKSKERDMTKNEYFNIPVVVVSHNVNQSMTGNELEKMFFSITVGGIGAQTCFLSLFTRLAFLRSYKERNKTIYCALH